MITKLIVGYLIIAVVLFFALSLIGKLPTWLTALVSFGWIMALPVALLCAFWAFMVMALEFILKKVVGL